jgi:hypothetical protein
MAKNVFTKIGRPAKASVLTTSRNPSTGERQGRAPMDGFRSELPAKAFPRGQSMPRHHDDPKFCGGGRTRR